MKLAKGTNVGFIFWVLIREDSDGSGTIKLQAHKTRAEATEALWHLDGKRAFSVRKVRATLEILGR